MAGLKENSTYSITVFASTVKGDGNISSPIIVTTGLKGNCSDTIFSNVLPEIFSQPLQRNFTIKFTTFLQ